MKAGEHDLIVFVVFHNYYLVVLMVDLFFNFFS